MSSTVFSWIERFSEFCEIMSIPRPTILLLGFVLWGYWGFTKAANEIFPPMCFALHLLTRSIEREREKAREKGGEGETKYI